MNEVSQKQQILQDLRRFVLARASIVYIQSDEEDRVEGLLKELSAQFQPRPRFFIWHPFQGLTDENEKIENTTNPVDAMDKVIQRTEGTIYLFEGLLSFVENRPPGDTKIEGCSSCPPQSVFHPVHCGSFAGCP